MFLAGLLLASIPISLALGVGIYVLRRHLKERESGPSRGAGDR